MPLFLSLFFLSLTMQTKDLYSIFLKHPIINTDTRRITSGSIFFALKGENFNGNRFAAEALEKGAAYVVVDEPVDTPPEKTILRKNTLLALQQLAVEHRKHLHAKVIAITGTNGKTTTKELLHAVLATKYNTISTKGNLNNHIGVPLTILSLLPSTQIAIVEMGANHPGEIGGLCKIADPDYGIITNIGKAHLEGFGSLQGILDTKKALLDHIIKKDNTIFFPLSDPHLNKLFGNTQNKSTWGDKTSDLWAKIMAPTPYLNCTIFSNKTTENKFPLEIHSKLFGEYNAQNILAATSVGLFFRIPAEDIKAAIEGYAPSNNRSQFISTDRNKLILDAYNANPVSMEQAITAFLALPQQNKILILGDMLELGDSSEEEHLHIITLIRKETDITTLCVGTNFQRICKENNISAFADVQELSGYLAEHPIDNSLILLKGSRGIQLESLVPGL